MSVVDTIRRPTDADIRAVERLLVNEDTLDLNKVKQPHRVARMIWAFMHHKYGARDCWFSAPEETRQLGYGSSWFVCWEGGPADWAVYFTNQGNIYGADYHWSGLGVDPYAKGNETALHLDNRGWFLEAYHSFSMSVHKN